MTEKRSLTPKTDRRIRQNVERDALTPEQRAFYEEAISCGAGHGDAMDAAHSADPR